MKTKIYILLTLVIFIFNQNSQAQIVIQNDDTFDTLSQMLLANELFESGEPFAESLGYDLDLLDPMVLNAPDSLSYTTGIESYEYSRYLLNTLTGRSGLGLHMMWSPVVMENAAMQDPSFDGTFTGGMINGFNEDDMIMMMIGNFGTFANQTPPANAFPQFADFMTGDTNLPQTVAADFQMDFSTTRWDRSLMDKTLNLGAMGQSMWKQYYWAQDMLGAFHDNNDEGVDATGSNSPDFPNSPDFDPNNGLYYGGNNLDGYIGQVLTAVSINKTKFLIDQLAFDGTNLGSVDPATYNPTNGIQYFPTKISVTETAVATGLPPQATNLVVVDPTSYIFDQLSYLLATVSFKNMMNPTDNSDAAHLAYHEVFDGNPFPADMATTGIPGPFDLMTGTSKVIFLNLLAMHFNSTEGTFIDEASLDTGGLPVMGNTISAENAAYSIVSLANFSNEFVNTGLQPMADAALIAQADFILTNFKDATGGFYNSFTVGSGASSSAKTAVANAAILRGLYAAYEATGDMIYLTEANNGYNYLINNFYKPSGKVFSTTINDDTAVFTPWNLAILSGALREASLVGNQADAAILYTRFFKTVINEMILSEAEASGETGNDSDGDGVPYISGGTKPFVFAAEANYDLSSLGLSSFDIDALQMRLFPNPANEFVFIEINLKKQANIGVTIIDVNGRIISANRDIIVSNGIQRISIPLGEISNGNYFIRISKDNELIAIKKIIVQ